MNKHIMSHFTGLNQETHTFLQQEVPNDLKSNSSAQCMKTRNRVFQLSSTSQAAKSGGVILFNIPPSNYSISKGTMFLRCTVTLTGSNMGNNNAGTGTVANAVGFQGPGILTKAIPQTSTTGAVNVYGAPALGNGYSWMQRLTLFGSSSSVVEQINYCNDQMNLMLIHNSNAAFLTSDGELQMGVGASFNYANNLVINNTSASIDLCLPIPLSCFNSTTQSFPLYLLSTPLSLQIDLSSVSRAIFAGSSATVSEYTVSNTYLVYQAVELPASYIEAERQAVKSSPFIMNLTSSLNVQVPQSILSSYTLGLNCSSLRCAFIMPSNSGTYASGTQLAYVRSTTDVTGGGTPATPFYFNGSGQNNILFIDGNQVNSAIYDTLQMVFSGMKGALHHNIQANVLYPSPGGYNNFGLQTYTIGWDTSSFDNEGSLFPGVPCTNLNFQMTGTAAAGANYLTTIICIYDVLVAFTADGAMEVKR